MKPYSLTRRLLWIIILVQLSASLSLVLGAAVYEGFSHFRTFDIMLRGRADSLLGAVQDSEDPQDNVMLDGTETAAPHRDIYAVRDQFGRMLGHSPNWPDPLPAFADSTDFRSLTLGRSRYRVIRITGLRMVDPGDKGGGIPRHVVILYGARTHPVWESILRTIGFYALLALLLLAASVFIMHRQLRQGLQPLTNLASQAAAVSVQSWQLQPTPEARRVQELIPLISALESALAGLERSFEQQKHFVSDAAHELKTSVAVLKSSLQLLTMKERDLEGYRAGLERAGQDCGRMEELVAGMLTLARLESAGSTVRPAEPVDLADVLAELMEHFRLSAELAQVRLVVETHGPVFPVGERENLRLLCSNLIHNALQHSAPGGEVRAIASAQGAHAELRIEDEGEGIPPEALPFVFDRFFRGDPSRSRRTGGTGLGLAISQAIVRSMEGDIRIRSTPGQGTQVSVSLPTSSAHLKLVQT